MFFFWCCCRCCIQINMWVELSRVDLKWVKSPNGYFCSWKKALQHTEKKTHQTQNSKECLECIIYMFAFTHKKKTDSHRSIDDFSFFSSFIILRKMELQIEWELKEEEEQQKKRNNCWQNHNLNLPQIFMYRILMGAYPTVKRFTFFILSSARVFFLSQRSNRTMTKVSLVCHVQINHSFYTY